MKFYKFICVIILYIICVSLVWLVSVNSAAHKVEFLLSSATQDLQEGMDTMLDSIMHYLGDSICALQETAKSHTVEDMSYLAEMIQIDEINIITPDGTIIASNVPVCLGESILDSPAKEFLELLDNPGRIFISQPFRHGISNPQDYRKYLAVAYDDLSGILQLGYDENRLADNFDERFLHVIKHLRIGENGYYLGVHEAGDKIVVASKDQRYLTQQRLKDIGLSRKILDRCQPSKTYTRYIRDQECYFRYFRYAKHDLIAIVPATEIREFTHTIPIVAAVVLLIVFLVAGGIITRLITTGQHLNAMRASEDALRSKDLSIAKTIQLSSLPDTFPAYPDIFEFNVFALMDPAREVGGDFYDFFRLGTGKLFVLIADVSGKGISAAMFMMKAKAVIQACLTTISDFADAMMQANERLCEYNDAEMFITAWAAVLDYTNGELNYINAGHNPPYLKLRDGTLQRIKGLRGLVLAALPKTKYRVSTIKLNPGDTLFLYTDGVTDAVNNDQEFYGIKRLEEKICTAGQELCTEIFHDVEKFAEGAEQSDDITMLGLDYFGPPRTTEKTFPAVQEHITDITKFIETFLNKTECPAKLIAKFNIATDEIVSNIIKFSESSVITVKVEACSGLKVWRLTFKDKGQPWNPLLHADPDTTLAVKERPIGGLGILMVKKLMDDLHYSRSGNQNVLQMRKAWTPEKNS